MCKQRIDPVSGVKSEENQNIKAIGETIMGQTKLINIFNQERRSIKCIARTHDYLGIGEPITEEERSISDEEAERAKKWAEEKQGIVITEERHKNKNIVSSCPRCGCPPEEIEYYNCGPLVRIRCPRCIYTVHDTEAWKNGFHGPDALFDYWNQLRSR